MVLCFLSVEETRVLPGVLVRMGRYLPPRVRDLWFLGWVQRGREFVVDFLCGVVPRHMEQQIWWTEEHLEHGAERRKVFQVSLVEFLHTRYQDRGSWLQKLKEAVSSPEHVYPRQVHAYPKHSCPEQVSPPEAKQPVYRPPMASLFRGLPLDMGHAIYADILRPDLVGARLLWWEAELVFPLLLSSWAQWHAELPSLLSGSPDTDLQAHMLQVDTGAFAFCPPTQVASEQQRLVIWHVDLLLCDRAKFHSAWPGDVTHLCRSSFNCAHVLPLLEGVMPSSTVRLD